MKHAYVVFNNDAPVVICPSSAEAERVVGEMRNIKLRHLEKKYERYSKKEKQEHVEHELDQCMYWFQMVPYLVKAKGSKHGS